MEETHIQLRPILTNTPLNLQLEFVYVTRNKDEIKMLMRLAYENPEKIKPSITIKDKVLLGANLKKLEK